MPILQQNELGKGNASVTAGKQPLKSFFIFLLATTYCPVCLQKQLVIDRLQEEIVRLKARLRHQERTAKEGHFGASTPSAKIPLKANTPPEGSPRRGRERGSLHSHDCTATPVSVSLAQFRLIRFNDLKTGSTGPSGAYRGGVDVRSMSRIGGAILASPRR
jgi:hypothetical protein